MIRELLGFVEELPLDYQPQPDPRDARAPERLHDPVTGRVLLIDQAVLDPMRGHIPQDETTSRVVQIQDLRVLRLRAQCRVMC